MKKEKFELEYSLFGSLGGLFNGRKTPLSPLGGGEFKPLTPDISEKLRASNVLDGQGQALANFSSVLEVLGQPEAYTRLRFIGAAKFIDYAIYLKQERQASLSATPTGLVIHLPAEPKEVFRELNLYLGETSVQNSSFEAHISVDEAVVIAALIDLRRSAFLRALSDHTPLTPAPFDIYMVTRTIASGLDPSQWLSGMLRNLCGLQNPLPSSQVQLALSSLANKGLLLQTERGFSLSEAAAFLADRLLVINNVIWLETAHANTQDKIAFTNMVCCQAGLNDLLCMLFNGIDVHLHASSPATLLDRIQKHLTKPDLLPAPPLVHTTLKLAVMSGPAAGQSYPLKAVTTLGRESECDIQVKDIKVSRKHAQIEKAEIGYHILDLGSTNGTYVNGVAITSPVLIKENDIIVLGETRLTLVSVPENGAPPASEATLYAGSGDLPLAGKEIPPAIETPNQSGLNKTGPFVSMPEESPAPPEPLVVPPQPIILPPPEVKKNICPTCGNEVAPGARFCGTCGQGM